MSTQVQISYCIPDEEWIRTARLRWQEDTFPLYHCFFGTVSFRVRDQEVLGTGHFDMSVADLAVGLAELLEKLRGSVSGVLRFQQSDDMLEIVCEIDGEGVSITHNLAPGRIWNCDRNELGNAILSFVKKFTNEAAAKVPTLLDWRDMGILGRFLTLDNFGYNSDNSGTG